MGRECLYEYGYDSNRQVQINLHEYCIWFFERLIILKLSHVSKYDNTAKKKQMEVYLCLVTASSSRRIPMAAFYLTISSYYFLSFI